MAEAYVYDAVRTPRGRGKKDGSLHEVPAVRLAAKTLEAIRDRNGMDTGTVDDIIFGCVDPVGEAGAVIPRAAAFEAGYDDKAPGMQISRFCASGLDAINFGAAKIAQGADDIVIAGGVESRSRVGMGSAGGAWFMGPPGGLPGRSGRPHAPRVARPVDHRDQEGVRARAGRRHHCRLLLRVRLARPVQCEFPVSLDVRDHPSDPLRPALPLILAASRFVFAFDDQVDTERSLVWIDPPVSREPVLELLIAVGA